MRIFLACPYHFSHCFSSHNIPAVFGWTMAIWSSFRPTRWTLSPRLLFRLFKWFRVSRIWSLGLLSCSVPYFTFFSFLLFIQAALCSFVQREFLSLLEWHGFCSIVYNTFFTTSTLCLPPFIFSRGQSEGSICQSIILKAADLGRSFAALLTTLEGACHSSFVDDSPFSNESVGDLVSVMSVGNKFLLIYFCE